MLDYLAPARRPGAFKGSISIALKYRQTQYTKSVDNFVGKLIQTGLKTASSRDPDKIIKISVEIC